VRIKLDENLPRSLRRSLELLGHEVDTVLDEGLGGELDETLWAIVQREQRFFITQDLDFAVTQENDLETWRGCFVVATERKVRVSAPDASKTEPTE
jgi:hypothetical protein